MTRSSERLLALQQRMQQADLDLVAVGPTANMQYLLEFAPHADERLCLLLVNRQGIRMVVPRLNQDDIAAHTDVELIGWADAAGPEEALRRALAGMPVPRAVAVDGSMRADFLLQLQQAVTPGRMLPADALIAPLRQRKSPAEVDALARAAAQADRAMRAAIDAAQPGATEADVAWAVEAAFRQDGAERVDFAIVASGPNSAYPHHHAGDRRLRRGDSVVIDIGATLGHRSSSVATAARMAPGSGSQPLMQRSEATADYLTGVPAGYKSDITRTVHLGQPSAAFSRAYAAVLEANRRATAAVRPGVTAGEVDRAARSALEAAGYGPHFVHRTGHGIGLEGHEAPYIMAGSPVALEEGMAFSIEPGAYLVGEFGVRIEDIVVVTDSGVRTLTGFGHDLIVKD